MTDVLAVGAHPDDLDLALGGTAIVLVDRGHDVHFVDVTTGEPFRSRRRLLVGDPTLFEGVRYG